MTKEQIGWFLFAVGLGIITVLLIGDVLTLIESKGKMDSAFVVGMLSHYGAVVSTFTAGKFLPQIGQKSGRKSDRVSDKKRAQLMEHV